MSTKIELQRVDKAYGNATPVIEALDLKIKAGSFTVLLGPSGCGKSTILRMIAGLENLTQGKIVINGKNMAGIDPGERGIAMVFQNYALYPTMTVRANIEFGLKNMKVPLVEREKRIADICEIVGLTEYLDRLPQTLSGGQRQRIALARAIVKKPEVFLMDEPLSNLDAKLRHQIRTELIELHRRLGTTFVYVTHDQVEAMSMGTDIILLEKGKIMQQDSPHQIYHYPNNVFTAQFIGSPPMNVLSLNSISSINAPKEACYVGFRPEHGFILYKQEAPPEDALLLSGDLLTHEMLGAETLYRVDTPSGKIHVKQFDGGIVDYGQVKVFIENSKLYFFDKDQQHIKSVEGRESTHGK